MAAALTGAQASVTYSPAANPYSPSYHHPYRHGVVPTIPQQQKMNHWTATHARPLAANNLNYGGGINGIGVTTGHEKVYLVFYGSQWGTQGTNSNGDVTLSGDPSRVAPYLQEMMKGLGTNKELWSGVMTQYCDGVATSSQTCPASNTQHVAYPTGGALAGVWVDESAASPQQATGHQLGVEAVNAAAHFGNTTAASNRSAQYVILSPTGTNPDGWLTGGFCAWHDYNGDSTLSGGPVTSPYGDIAFTNLPYIPDQGSSCGANFVNSNGPLDGVSIVGGHEYAETITDQNPPGGWTDSTGAENGDKCAWKSPGTAGGSFNLTVATGTFAMQTTWGNDGNGGAGACQASHPIVGNGGGGTLTGQIKGPYGKCLDDYKNLSKNGNQADIWTCLTNGASQQWTVAASGTGEITHNGYCLDVTGNRTANGTKVQLWSCLNDAAQQWTFMPDGTLQHAGKCLDDTNYSSVDGTQVQIWTCTGKANQLWAKP